MSISSLAHAGIRNAAHLWRNGEIVSWEDARIHVTSVGHASVSAVFEGIKAYWNAETEELYVLALREHMERLVCSARLARLGIDWSAAALCEATISLLEANQTRCDTYIRPWVFASGVIRELMVRAAAPTETVIDTWPFESALLSQRVCRATITSWRRISEATMPPRIKAFSNYHNSRLALADAQAAGYDWPIFMNERNTVSESAGACIMLIFGNELVTPSLASSILPSITRKIALNLACDVLDMKVTERDVDRTELYMADELFFVGTGWEILPVVGIDGFQICNGTVGAKTRAFQTTYDNLVRGRLPEYARWLTPIANGNDELAPFSLNG